MSEPKNRYNPAEIEPKWQRIWDERRPFVAARRPGSKGKYYILDMFPYPSGAGLHVGHPEGYTATDILARYKRMRGFDVLHPMGWDAFGLPAEQHAIRTGTHPRKTTLDNIATFRRQLKMLGFSYDWDREIDTTDPEYVKWTQWIFLKLFERGLAYQAETPVNWCAALGTVLANEEVIDGRSEIGGHPVERLPLRQWMLKITAYADRLDADLEGLDWPETKAKQHHWIGRSEGAEVDFRVEGSGDKIRVFTTRVDTLPGATYVVLAPEHPLTLKLVSSEQRAEVERYVAAAARKSDMDRTDLARTKTGVALGRNAINPINGEKVPIWVADYVLGAYGTGAIMAVPAHDERDHAFAKTYGLPIVQVIAPADGSKVDVRETPYTVASEEGVAHGIRARLPIPDGMPAPEVRRKITEELAATGEGCAKVTYRLRDWVFSRQRYWGEPIPIYFPVECDGDPRVPGAKVLIRYDQPIPVDERELPLRLPELDDFRPGNDPAGPLARVPEWRFFQKDGKWFARETNTMPQWAGSCWYYLRFLDPKNTKEAWSQKAYADWMPVDLYVGGSEHAVLHLLYARFWHKVLFDIGVVRDSEPFKKLVHQGLILGTSYRYYAKEDGSLLSGATKVAEREVDGKKQLFVEGTNEAVEEKWAREAETEVRGTKTFHKALGVEVVMVAEKMSKSRGNVVNPDDIVRDYGADSLRLYEMFMGPLEQVKPWQTSGIEGVRRFLDRVWTLCTGAVSDDAKDFDDETRRQLHKTVKKVTDDIEAMRFNTAISAMMIFAKHLGGLGRVPREAAKTLTLLVSPFAPHLGEELWERLGAKQSLAYEPWPSYDEALVRDTLVEIGVQVNGKLRGVIQLPVDADEAAAKSAAFAEPKVKQQVEGKTVKKVIYVPGKILNLIVG
jgi:leucyl-tRNA synthetase